MLRTVILMAASAGATATASAEYVGSVFGLLGETQVSDLDVIAGSSFRVAVVLNGEPGSQADFALFRLVFSEPGVHFGPNWFNWSSPFTTGGIDDFSTPPVDAPGVIEMGTATDPFNPNDVDVIFENVSDNFGDFFGTGTILTLELIVPDDFSADTFTISFAPDTFTAGFSFVTAEAGDSLTVNVLPIPTPGTLVIAGLVIASGYRRRSRA